jgi:hypothetical protein
MFTDFHPLKVVKYDACSGHPPTYHTGIKFLTSARKSVMTEIRLNKTYSEIHTNKNLSDTFSIYNGLK